MTITKLVALILPNMLSSVLLCRDNFLNTEVEIVDATKIKTGASDTKGNPIILLLPMPW